jgi:manganese/zinc/iron transport system substrate-binding protein
MDALNTSDAVFYHGLDLEGRIVDALQALRKGGKTVVAVTQGMPKNLLREPAEFEGKYDPHVWFDVALWKIAAELVNQALAQMDPGSANVYRQNTEAYLRELDALDSEIRQQIKQIPESERVLVTNHETFGYFGQRYGFEVRGVQGASTASEVSVRDVQELTVFVCERKVKALFVETSAAAASIDAVRAAARDAGCEVTIGGELFAESLGEAGTPEATYLGMMRHNINAIVAGLK